MTATEQQPLQEISVQHRGVIEEGRATQDCKCLFWIDMHSMRWNCWDCHYVTANPWVLANICGNVLKRVQVRALAAHIAQICPTRSPAITLLRPREPAPAAVTRNLVHVCTIRLS